ncbi:HAD hydrolase-like protein [Microbacterium sp.]|uniref:HAD hydrolase-like protein n=1 Tax=Microbacterium sp. TaxID=51671 RepID=UPI00345D14EF
MVIPRWPPIVYNDETPAGSDTTLWDSPLASDNCPCRKPNPGMALEYLEAHPEIRASLSVMIGDTDSDVEMGRRLAAETGGCAVFRIDHRNDPEADVTFASLAEFARGVGSALEG